MIKALSKILANSALLGFFLVMLALPIAFLGIANYNEKPVVLSAQDSKESSKTTSGNIQEIQGKVPQDVEKYIMKMENEYYKNSTVQNNSPSDEANSPVETIPSATTPKD